MTAIYRAAVSSRPYFGRGSYWTLSAEFARCFAEWAAAQPALAQRGPYVIYRAEADLIRVHEFDVPLYSDVVSAAAGMLAAEGHEWVAFVERGAIEGLSDEMARLTRTCKQYIYIGEVALAAARCD